MRAACFGALPQEKLERKIVLLHGHLQTGSVSFSSWLTATFISIVSEAEARVAKRRAKLSTAQVRLRIVHCVST